MQCYSACCARNKILYFLVLTETLLTLTYAQYIGYARYTGCPRRNVSDFGRVLLMLKFTDITQNTYVQSGTVTEIMAREV